MTDKLISVFEATQILSQHLLSLEPESVPLMQSNGRILAEDIVADRPFPPFDRVTMDGIGIVFAEFEAGRRRFEIAGIQAAGQEPLISESQQQCVEVMTGAVVPMGVDVIVRYEDVKIEKGVAKILIEKIDFQQNIHQKGSNRAENDVLVLRGGKISPAEIATAATVGKAFLEVIELPRVAVVSTGDELVGIAQSPLPHQIRRSNAYAIAALLKENIGIDADLFHYNDDATVITEGVQKLLRQYDVIILSGGISEGKYDFVPKALTDNGVESLFHGVSQRPGKPFWLGVLSPQKRLTRATQVVFALPGNPVSTFMCAVRYVLPYLKASLIKNASGENAPIAPTEFARLATDFDFKPQLTHFLQVKSHISPTETLTTHNSQLITQKNTEGCETWATPLAGGGSGDLANLNTADGFLELPSERTHFKQGEVFPFWRFR
jgi:molybdopterin molybdotransferase